MMVLCGPNSRCHQQVRTQWQASNLRVCLLVLATKEYAQTAKPMFLEFALTTDQ